MDNHGYERQINQMCSFILQEANEKANEVRIKTDHDFNLEKTMQVHSAKQKLQAEFKTKEKNLETESRIKKSIAIGEARIKKMKERESIMGSLKEETALALAKLTTDKAKYKQLLKNLILQGLIKVNEPKVGVLCRKEDIDIVQSVLSEASAEYTKLIKETTNQSAKSELYIIPDKNLPPAPCGDGKQSCAGGIKLSMYNGRIVCDNTLDCRLSIAFGDLMPDVRKTLFTTSV